VTGTRNNTLFSHPQESAFKCMGWNTVTKTSSINFTLDYQNSILITSIILLLRWVNKMIEEDETRLVLKKILKIEVGARFNLKLKLSHLDCLLI
jgi:hypothetical protein